MEDEEQEENYQLILRYWKELHNVRYRIWKLQGLLCLLSCIEQTVVLGYLLKRKKNGVIYEDAMLEDKVSAIQRIVLNYTVKEDLDMSVGEVKRLFTP